MRNIFLLIFGFYILILFQTSFLVHFNIMGVIPNLMLLAVVLINFIEEPGRKLGIFAGFLGGLFLDVFSSNFLGFYILISLAVALFFKYAVRRQIRIWT
jgi:rod shape-determining protein MreD